MSALGHHARENKAHASPLLDFGVAGTVSPLTAELAAVTRQLPGVGCKFEHTPAITTSMSDLFSDAHVYGAFNIAYGIGSARKCHVTDDSNLVLTLCILVGPIIGGQVGDLSR